MESAIAITDRVYWVGANDRETDLFEGIWPLPQGVAYNAYLILEDKTAAVDTIKAISTAAYLEKVAELLGGRKLDYLIVNHLEPDHSGSMKALIQAYPGLTIVGNKKTADFMAHLYGITENVQVVGDGDQLDLGGRKLSFHLIPMVHWPETMVTYDQLEKVLFSCDAFGGFGQHVGGIFDDEIDVKAGEGEMLRYYSNIVGKYSVMVQKALEKLAGVEIKIICPSHGPVWRQNPGEVIARYDRWSKFEAEPGVVLAHGSMYGNSNRMMEAVTEGLGAAGVKNPVVHDVSRTHHSFILRDAWRYSAVILGAPAYDTKLYPPMAHLIDLFERKVLKNRTVGIFGTYGWSGGGVSTMKEFALRVKWDLVEPVVEARFSPTEDNLKNCRRLGETIARRIT